MPARTSGEVVEDVEVLFDLLDRARPADLHDDVGAVAQARRVRLPDRSGGQRLGIETSEDDVRVTAQLE
jgi:hypothetical protein